VGHTNSIRVEEGKLLASGVVSRDTGAAREIVVSAANGFPWQASIGASVEEFEFVKAQQKTIVNGREFIGPVNVIRKALLGEISCVDLGADGQTSASVLAAANALSQENDDMDENEVTTTEGQPETTATEAGTVTATADQANGAQASASITEQVRAQALTGVFDVVKRRRREYGHRVRGGPVRVLEYGRPAGLADGGCADGRGAGWTRATAGPQSHWNCRRG